MSIKKNNESKRASDVVDAVCDTVELHYRDLHRCVVAVAATGGDAMSTTSVTRPVGFNEGKLRAKSAQEKVRAVAELQSDACGLLRAALMLCDTLADDCGSALGARLSEDFASVCAEVASKGVKRFRVVAVEGDGKEEDA